jgi:hypothetical protein
VAGVCNPEGALTWFPETWRDGDGGQPSGGHSRYLDKSLCRNRFLRWSCLPSPSSSFSILTIHPSSSTKNQRGAPSVARADTLHLRSPSPTMLALFWAGVALAFAAMGWFFGWTTPPETAIGQPIIKERAFDGKCFQPWHSFTLVRSRPLTRMRPFPAAVAHICIVHRELLRAGNRVHVATFYEELGIPKPYVGRDESSLREMAWNTIQTNFQRLYPLSYASQWRVDDAYQVDMGPGSVERLMIGMAGDESDGERAAGERAAGREGGPREDDYLRALIHVYEILSDQKKRGIYDTFFMPKLTARWGRPTEFIQSACFWGDEDE